jgi:hypothetical protein
MSNISSPNPVETMLNRLALNQKHAAPAARRYSRPILQSALGQIISGRGATRPLPVGRDKLLQGVLRAGAMYAGRLRTSRSENLSEAQKAQMRQSVVKEALERGFDKAELSGSQRADVERIVSDVLRLVENHSDKLLAQQQKIEKVAKDFEGIFVRQIMDVMRKTVDESGLGEDATGKQVRDMYWMFLGDQVAQTGSLGMWKQIAADIARSQQGMTGSTLETLE